MVRCSLHCNWSFCHDGWDVVFDHCPVVGIPMIFAELSEWKNCSIFSRSTTLTKKSNCLTYTVASSLVCTSPLAVIIVVGFLDVLMVSNSAELRSLLLTTCILAPESTTNYLSSGSFVDAPGVPIPPGESRMQPCLFLWACKCFEQDSKPCFQSLHGTLPQISWRRDFADEDFLTCTFPSDRPFFFRILAWRIVDCVNRTRRIDPKTSCVGLPRYFSLFGSPDDSESCETQPFCGTVFTKATAFLSSLSLPHWEWVALLRLFIWFFFNLAVRLCNPFHFHRIDTQTDANIHKTFAWRYLSNNICTVVEESLQGYFCLWYFSSSTHFDLVRRNGSEGVAAVCSGFCARSLL